MAIKSIFNTLKIYKNHIIYIQIDIIKLKKQAIVTKYKANNINIFAKSAQSFNNCKLSCKFLSDEVNSIIVIILH